MINQRYKQRTITKKQTPKKRAFGSLNIGIWIWFVPCLLFLVSFLSCSPRPLKPLNHVCFKSKCINVEVVQKSDELQRGLQFRTSLAPVRGMLFIFSQSTRQSFWMKNTLIPLDIIWMDYARRVVHIEKDVPPCKGDPCPTYTPAREALYVLEINAGYADILALQVGDVAEFHLEEQ